MNKQDLDALANLYEEVHCPQDLKQLDEASNPNKDVGARMGNAAASTLRDLGYAAAQQADVRNQARARLQKGFSNFGRSAENVINKLGGYSTARGTSATVKPQRQGPTVPQRIANAPTAQKLPSTTLASTSSNPVTRTAIERPSTVLAKKGGVEGRLDKATGKFTSGAFSSAEKSRYASVAAKNTASSAQSTSAKPAVGKLGSTSFERRTPTSAELRAAQAARKSGASPEQALQAAQKTNLPTTGPSPAIPDLKSVNADLAKANANINNSAPAGTALAVQQAQQKKPPTPGIGATKPMTQSNSYEWPSGRKIKDLANAYSSIYEAKKKVDQDEDGDNDFADVRIARMIASGVPKEVAIAKTKNKSYNKEEFELDEGKKQFPHKKVDRQVYDAMDSGETAGDAGNSAKEKRDYDRAEKMRSVAAKFGGKTRANEEFELDEATAMTKRGYDEAPIRKKIAKTTGGGEFADRATALENQPTYGNTAKQKVRQNLARKQRGDFRSTTSSSPGLHGYDHKSDDPAVKAKQAARGAQRGALTPKEKKQLNREAYEAYEFVASYLLENNFASTIENANVIINNMSECWFNQIMEG